MEVTDPAGLTASRSAAIFVVPTSNPLPFNLLYPQDGLEVGQDEVDVFGVTKTDAVVVANGIPLEVNALGLFAGSLTLEDGANLIEVIATDILGNLRSATIAVFYAP